MPLVETMVCVPWTLVGSTVVTAAPTMSRNSLYSMAAMAILDRSLAVV